MTTMAASSSSSCSSNNKNKNSNSNNSHNHSHCNHNSNNKNNSSSIDSIANTKIAEHNVADGCAVDADAETDAAATAAMHNGREARNLAEKQRRDKLNASIQELATMVPHVAESTRRLDKTAVLRFATHGLRLDYIFGKSVSKRKRKHCSTAMAQAAANVPQLTDSLMQLLDSFFLTLTCNGQIVLISASVEQLLGHCQSDLYGQNILHITHPDDQALLRQQIIPHDIELLFLRDTTNNNCGAVSKSNSSNSSSSSSSSNIDTDELMDASEQSTHYHHTANTSGTVAHLSAIDARLRADRRCFTVRLARATTRSEATRHYEYVKIDGCFRRSDSSITGGAANFPIVSQLIRRSRNTANNHNTNNNQHRANIINMNGTGDYANGNSNVNVNGMPYLPQHDAIAQAALHGISGNDIVLVAMARVIREPRIQHRQPESNQLEYRTRHLIDGRIIDCDQRIGIVAGYMKDEVRNLSPFSFMHQDDVRWVIVALRQMYDCNSDYGESCYRLLSRNGHFIYLQTKGYLEIDRSTNKVHSFLCVNTLLNEQDGQRKVQEMKNKFSTIINAKIPNKTMPDLPASRNPQQLERIVLYLIENLQKRTDNNAAAGAAVSATAINDINSINDGYTSGGSEHDNRSPAAIYDEYARSPQPLALVPPEPASVKTSISKSVNVVNITAARNLSYRQEHFTAGNAMAANLAIPTCHLNNGNSNDGSNSSNSSGGCLSESSILSPASSEEHMDDALMPVVMPIMPVTPPAPSRASVLQRLPLSITIPMPAAADAAAIYSPSANVNSSSNCTVMLLQQLPVLQQQEQNITTTAAATATTTITTTTDASLENSNGYSNSNSSDNCDGNNSSSTSTKLHAALTCSFRQLDDNLQALSEEAQTLRQQHTLLMPRKKKKKVPCENLGRQLDAIMLEHEKQKKILVNIKTEYSEHQQKQEQQLHATSTIMATEQSTLAMLPTSIAATAMATPVRTASVITSNVTATIVSPRQRQNRRSL